MTQKDIVDYIVSQNIELKQTYSVYENLLYCLKSLFTQVIDSRYGNISKYMKTSLKTLNVYKDKIFNNFDFNYYNGFIEGNNNFIKVIKRIAFGYRKYEHFISRIFLIKGIIKG